MGCYYYKYKMIMEFIKRIYYSKIQYFTCFDFCTLDLLMSSSLSSDFLLSKDYDDNYISISSGMHEEVVLILSEKKDMILKLRKQIAQSEELFFKLKARSRFLEFQLKEDREELGDESEKMDLEKKKVNHLKRLSYIIEEHKKYVEELNNEFKRKLKAAEDYTDQRLSSIRAEKTQMIENLKDYILDVDMYNAEEKTRRTVTRKNLKQDLEQEIELRKEKVGILRKKIEDFEKTTEEQLRGVHKEIICSRDKIPTRIEEHEAEVESYKREIESQLEYYAKHFESLRVELEKKKETLEKEIVNKERKMYQLYHILDNMYGNHKQAIDSIYTEVSKLSSYSSSLRDRSDTLLARRSQRSNSVIATTRNCPLNNIQIGQRLSIVQEELENVKYQNKELEFMVNRVRSSLNGL